ncbi:MAG: C40 family peptidase [Candidatus Velthaea sp.]
MRRLILTGIFVSVLSASGFGIAAADQTLPAATTTVSSAAAASPAVAQTANPESVDAAQPTAGADLVMWNAAPAAQPSSAEPATRVSRLRRFAGGIVNRSSAIAASLTRSALRFIGTPFVFGGTRPGGFDCSGYVQHVYALLGIHLPRTADAQYDAGHRIAAGMKPGDLVFFHTYAPGVSHVGIYLGNNRFIHSSSSHGVAISSLHNRYWAPRYLGAKRVFGS